MKNTLKLTISNLIFSLIYLVGHYIFSIIAHDMFSDMPYLFMRICYVVISFVVFLILGKILKCESKKIYLTFYLVFCAISIIFCILNAIFDTYVFVVFNTAPLLFYLENLGLLFPILEELEIPILIVMLMENAMKILTLYLGANFKFKKCEKVRFLKM